MLFQAVFQAADLLEMSIYRGSTFLIATEGLAAAIAAIAAIAPSTSKFRFSFFQIPFVGWRTIPVKDFYSGVVSKSHTTFRRRGWRSRRRSRRRPRRRRGWRRPRRRRGRRRRRCGRRNGRRRGNCRGHYIKRKVIYADLSYRGIFLVASFAIGPSLAIAAIAAIVPSLAFPIWDRRRNGCSSST